MEKKNIPFKIPLQNDWSETEMLAANLLQAHLFGLPKQEQERIIGSIVVHPHDESSVCEVDTTRLIPLLNRIAALSIAEMDVWLADATLTASFRQSIRKAKDALRQANFASLEKSSNAYLTRILEDLYKKVEK